jgi:hypothetical protein
MAVKRSTKKQESEKLLTIMRVNQPALSALIRNQSSSPRLALLEPTRAGIIKPRGLVLVRTEDPTLIRQ